MKLDKAQLAHEIAVSMQSVEPIVDMGLLAKLSWNYADAMQAESDKRVVKGVPEVLNSTNSTPLDWQPDWSQAPTDKPVVHWAKMEMGQFMWIWYSKGAPIYIPAPDFGYIGHWKESLRKRPEGK